MSEEERRKLLLEWRKQFRSARPDLNLPPAGDELQPQTGPEQPVQEPPAAPKSKQTQRKLAELEETGRQDPRKVAQMIKRYTDSR